MGARGQTRRSCRDGGVPVGFRACSRADGYPERVRLAVGTCVAYPGHGVGRIGVRERRPVLGVEQDVVVIEFEDGLTVMLPLERARALLRPPVNEAGVFDIQKTLRADGVLSDEAWSKRVVRTQEKLRNGDPLELAEIVRDGARREREANSNGAPSKLSPSERSLCARARELLSGEIGLVRGLDRTAANVWIDEQLTAAPG